MPPCPRGLRTPPLARRCLPRRPHVRDLPSRTRLAAMTLPLARGAQPWPRLKAKTERGTEGPGKAAPGHHPHFWAACYHQETRFGSLPPAAESRPAEVGMRPDWVWAQVPPAEGSGWAPSGWCWPLKMPCQIPRLGVWGSPHPYRVSNPSPPETPCFLLVRAVCLSHPRVPVLL